MYSLDNSFARGNFAVTVVGCGGTGGFLAERLCQLLPQRATLVLVDHDRVEERNLVRQNFIREDVGRFKSEALALRLSRRFNRAVAYSTLPIALTQVTMPGLVIGCVDNGPARRGIARTLEKGFQFWWVDAGNGENYGQILIGNSPRNGVAYEADGEHIVKLPFPTVQRPELLAQAPPRQEDCAQIAEQGPTINQLMASLLLEVIRRLIDGRCSWMQLYLDMEAGTLHPVPAMPEVIGKRKDRKRR
jgi:molybdopterin/thiamine biosynthesis adenylyltransferase